MSSGAPSAAHAVPSGPARTVSGSGLRRLADYAEMCRPRIAVMTAAAVSAGYILASPIILDWAALIPALAGILLLAAASGVFNQVLEIRSDALMSRTADRPLVTGRVLPWEAVLLGLGLAGSGAVLLWGFSTPAAAITTVLTFFCYVLIYTPLKSRSPLCTTVGAFPGAMPPVLGWLAAGGRFDMGAVALFALLFVWQFPHFLAIGWMYRNEYHRAGLKMLPSFADGGRRTALVALVYAVAFVPVSLLPTHIGMTGPLSLSAGAVLSSAYLVATLSFVLKRTTARARGLLRVSLVVLPMLLMIMVAEFLYLTVPG